MFCRLLTIVLVLPFLSPSNATRICNNANATALADEYFRGFYVEVKNSLEKTYEQDLFRKTIRYLFGFNDVANKSCYHDTFSRERDGLEFNKLMKFSITHGFRGFVEDGGVGCIAAIKDDITKCVNNIVGTREGADDKYHTLWLSTAVGFGLEKGPCKQVAKLKNCTLSAIRNEGYYKCLYDPNVAIYVGSLFEFFIERCKRLKRISDDDLCIQTSSAIGMTSLISVLLGLLLALVVILLTYLVIRDCRGSNSSWKLNVFTLRGQGQTQFQNETPEEN